MPRKPSRSQWVHLVRRAVVQSSLAGLLVWTVGTAQVQTDIAPDGTMGTEVVQTGTTHDITGGTRPGNGQNLFHSFDRFSVGTGDTARFASDPGVDHIISRVTGGAESIIDGTLQAEANLFLLNPQGLMFGPQATLNVNGSFHASTADELRFTDGATFSARLSERTTLTVAAPSAFGFFSENPAGITIADSQLEVPDGESLSIVGGDIRIIGDGDPSSGAPTISAPGGRVSIVSVASSGKVGFDPTNHLPELDVGSFDQLGEIDVMQGAQIDASGEGGGTVVIRGGRLLSDNATITSLTLGSALGGTIDIEAESLTLTGGAFISTNTVATATGSAGEITITAIESIVIDGHDSSESPSALFSNTFGSGDAGHISVSAPSLSINSGKIQAASSGTSRGNAGDITVKVGQLTLREGAQIDSSSFVAGQGGTMMVTATNSIVITGRDSSGSPSGLFANSQGTGPEAGAAGSVVVAATNVTVTDGAAISSSAFGPGQGGNVRIDAADTVTLAGMDTILDASGNSGGTVVIWGDRLIIDGANIFVDTNGDVDGKEVGIDVQVDEEVILTNGALVTTDVVGDGNAGSIRIIADRIDISEEAILGSRAFSGVGSAGTITLIASDLRVAGGRTRIDAGTRGKGPAGSILLKVDRLTIIEGAQISTTTRGAGPGGTLTVIADESINIIDESGGEIRSGLFSNSGEGEGGEPTGDAGDIVIKAPQLTVDGGRILSRTLGDGNAGNITIEVDRLELLGGGQIFNGIGNAQEDDSVLGNPDGEGHGGTSKVTARESIVIAGRDRAGFPSGLFSSAQIGSGDAGHLVVSAPRIEMRAGGRIEASSIRQSQGRAGTLTIDEVEHLILMEGAQIASLSAGDGQGGDIVIRGDRIQLIDNATISSESLGTGDAGNIRIAAQDVDLRDNSAITTTVNQGEANGGNIVIGGTITDDGDIPTSVERLSLDGSRIVANTDAGDGANIAIGARQVVLDSNSEITANTNAGIGGNVTIAGTVAADRPALTRAEAIVLRDSRITAKAQEGQGGRIDIVAEAVLLDPASEIDASSQEGGIDGEVKIEAVRTNLSEIVTPLSPRFDQTAALLSDPCVSRLQRGIVSSLVIRERDSVPATPDGLLPSRLHTQTIDPAVSESAVPRQAPARHPPVRWNRRPCP